MPVLVKMPALSPTMTEGKIVGWLVKEGDSISPGTGLFEIETDKAVMEVESVDEGVIGKILIQESSAGVAVNSGVAVLLEEGETEEDLNTFLFALSPDPFLQPQNSSKESCTPLPPAHSDNEDISLEKPSDENLGPQNNGHAPNKNAQQNVSRLIASPLAKNLARKHGVDFSHIHWQKGGSGPRGRIVAQDIQDFLTQKTFSPLEPQASSPFNKGASFQAMSDNTITEIPLTSMRRVIAQRLCQSKQTAPHFYLTVHCAMDHLLKLRKDLNHSLTRNPYDHGSNTSAQDTGNTGTRSNISVTHWIIKACAAAMEYVPQANRIWFQGTDSSTAKIMEFSQVDLAVAVAIDDGLVTPVLRNVKEKNLSHIAQDLTHYVHKARQGRLSSEDMQGGSMTISNLGMYKIDSFSAILNPPHSSILAVGGLKTMPSLLHNEHGAVHHSSSQEAENSQYSRRNKYSGPPWKWSQEMTLTLSVDHRVLDGAVAAKFLKAIKDALENPLGLLL